MSVTKPKLSLEKVLHLLRRPDARLVRLHSNNGGAGFYVWPGGGRVPDEVAQLLLGRNDIQPYDSGFFPVTHRAGAWAAGKSGPSHVPSPCQNVSVLRPARRAGNAATAAGQATNSRSGTASSRHQRRGPPHSGVGRRP